MKRAVRYAAIGAAALAGAALVVASGVIPVEASSGHWAITAWFLHTVMNRSVATHSLGIEAPPLDDPELVRLGAGHYEEACASCHGAPGRPMPVVAAGMTPRPPDLAAEVGEYDPEDLFYIVKHGIKFTGMPAWPSQRRDDEIWPVVAFLRALPGLDGADYEALVAAPAAEEAPEVVVERCAPCHDADGVPAGIALVPRLAGQRVAYLEHALRAYGDRERESGIMQPIAAALDPDQAREAARWYAGLPPGPPATMDSERVERGARVALDGGEDGRGARCVHCHGPKDGPVNPAYPELGGQRASYLAAQLRLFREGRRGGSGQANIMRVVTAHALDPDAIDDVAAYYASLAPR